MRLLPSGTTALLAELDDLDQVQGVYDALCEAPPPGVVDVVPAARTILVVVDPAVTTLAAVAKELRTATPGTGRRDRRELVEVPVVYDGEDLAATAALLGWEPAELVRRHTAARWSVAFCGFAPGFGYLASPDWPVEVPRRSAPRTVVPPGAVALAAEFSGVYPRESPGGWQLVGRTPLQVFDLSRDPAALLRPGVRVRFVEVRP
jgi:KipI family sensor histidine kinase inhibitor